MNKEFPRIALQNTHYLFQFAPCYDLPKFVITDVHIDRLRTKSGAHTINLEEHFVWSKLKVMRRGDKLGITEFPSKVLPKIDNLTNRSVTSQLVKPLLC